jgi:hypothetical protein
MKKPLLALLLVFVLGVGFTGAASAAPANAGGTVKLVSALHIPGAGVMFTFEVSGAYSKAGLQGSVTLPDGRIFDLYCNQVDDTTVKCSVTKAVAEQNVTVSFGGQQFPALVHLRELKECPYAPGYYQPYCPPI